MALPLDSCGVIVQAALSTTTLCSLKAGNFLVISWFSLPSMVPGWEKVFCSYLMHRLGVYGGKKRKSCSSGLRVKCSFTLPDVFSYLKCIL